MDAKQVILTFLAMPRNAIYDSPRSILRPFYDIYFCHITIAKWFQICTGTIRNSFLKDIQFFFCYFLIVIPIVNFVANLDHEGVELSL